jgi:hypothetical protein
MILPIGPAMSCRSTPADRRRDDPADRSQLSERRGIRLPSTARMTWKRFNELLRAHPLPAATIKVQIWNIP